MNAGEPGFDLEHPAQGSCLINEGDTFVLTGELAAVSTVLIIWKFWCTGGHEPNSYTGNFYDTFHGNVDRYLVKGIAWFKNLNN